MADVAGHRAAVGCRSAQGRRSAAGRRSVVTALGALVLLLPLALAVPAAGTAAPGAPVATRSFDVSLRAAESAAAVGDRVRFRGRVSPDAGRQRVRLERRTPSGWKTVARDRLSRLSRFSLTVEMRWSGPQTFRTVKPRTRARHRGVSNPVTVTTYTADRWLDVSTGGHTSCGVRADRTLWCWGERYDSVHGSSVALRPEQVGTVATWADVEVGPGHACGVRTDGSAWCWGGNADYQLGRTTPLYSAEPLRVGSAKTWLRVVPLLSGSCGLRAEGAVHCWGYDVGGLHGDGATDSHPEPRKVGRDNDWTALTAGHSHLCATKTDGSAWCWGDNWAGAVGDGSTTTRTAPTRVGGPAGATDWLSLEAGAAYTCGLRAGDGAGPVAWCWGDNSYGQLGDGTDTNRTTPVPVVGAAGWASLTTGDEHTCGVRADGSAHCWGRGHTAVPAGVGGGDGWLTLHAGVAHACGLRDHGGSPESAWCFGENYYGQLGTGTRDRSAEPVGVLPTSP